MSADAGIYVGFREYTPLVDADSTGARTVSVPPWHGIDTEFFFGFGG
jgi:hypothetical protein